jgi:hypothetical protein
MIDSTKKLDIGGSSGASKGNFYEKHFKEILENLGYKIIDKKDFKKIDPSKKEVHHLYRFPPDKFTEVDFYIPEKNIGFCVTNISQLLRFRSDKKINEFNELNGDCPHCGVFFNNQENLDQYLKWRCKKCFKIILPFELKNPTNKKGKPVSLVKDNSAILQAHKQAYYRIGELVDLKISSNNQKIVEIIYNEKEAWRNWSHVMNFFFDECFFVFSEFKGLIFGSDDFQNKFKNKINLIINKKTKDNYYTSYVLDYYRNNKKDKSVIYESWFDNFRKTRKEKWGEDLPIGYPIRYSIYDLIIQNGKLDKNIDVYLYKAIVNILNNKNDKNDIILLKNNKLLSDKNKINDSGLEIKKNYENKYLEFINKIENENIKTLNLKDYWNRKSKDSIINVLKYLYEISTKNYWYKFIMIAKNDINEINQTPFIDYQYEPLELLTRLKLIKLQKLGIIKKIHGELREDYKEESWISKALNTESKFMLGSDFVLTLKNNKILHIQCKSNSSFKKWLVDKSINNSGITYKDTKRMIAHNLLSSFEINNEKIKHSDDRNYIGIIDGNWTSNKDDRYKLIRMMFYMGVDDLFFADELDFRFENYIKKLSN